MRIQTIKKFKNMADRVAQAVAENSAAAKETCDTIRGSNGTLSRAILPKKSPGIVAVKSAK